MQLDTELHSVRIQEVQALELLQQLQRLVAAAVLSVVTLLLLLQPSCNKLVKVHAYVTVRDVSHSDTVTWWQQCQCSAKALATIGNTTGQQQPLVKANPQASCTHGLQPASSHCLAVGLQHASGHLPLPL